MVVHSLFIPLLILRSSPLSFIRTSVSLNSSPIANMQLKNLLPIALGAAAVSAQSLTEALSSQNATLSVLTSMSPPQSSLHVSSNNRQASSKPTQHSSLSSADSATSPSSLLQTQHSARSSTPPPAQQQQPMQSSSQPSSPTTF